jgi:hypothetical protein
MIRTALRLSTIAALTNGGQAPYPTLVGAHVYDSRKDDISDLIVRQTMDLVIVRTDEDSQSYRDARSGTISNVAPHQSIALRLEYGVMAAAKVEGETDEYLVGFPPTDAGTELKLDLLDWQIKVALGGFGPWAQWWRGLWIAEELSSRPLWTSPEGDRLRKAVREMTIWVRARLDCLPMPVAVADLALDAQQQSVAPIEIPAPLDAVLAKIAGDGNGELQAYGARLHSRLLAQDLPMRPVAPMLGGIRMKIPAPKKLEVELYGN